MVRCSSGRFCGHGHDRSARYTAPLVSAIGRYDSSPVRAENEPELGLNPGVPLFMGEPRQRTKILTAVAARLRAYYDDLRERFAHDAEEILSRAEQQKRD
jgi:hypothetical protein